MGIPVAELQQRMDSREFAHWLAFYGLEPFGSEVESLRTGIIAKVVADVNRPKGKAPYPVTNFMPGKASVKKTADQLKAGIMGFVKAHNARVKAKGVRRG